VFAQDVIKPKQNVALLIILEGALECPEFFGKYLFEGARRSNGNG
jgi:hypothetical protein